jgi:PAS domain S-box-containing protein
MLDSIHTGVLLIHPGRHEIVYVNSFAADMIGATRAEIVGRTCHDFVCPAEKGTCPITDRHERVDNSERTLIRADGSRIPILKSVMPMQFDGEEHIIESFIDISAIKKTEQELREANDELQSFVYSASHDMRQPLVNIKGFTGELDRSLHELQSILMRSAGLLPDGDRDRISAIMSEDIQSSAGYIGLSVDRMSSLVDAILKLSHLGQRALKPESVDMQILVRTVLDSHAGQIRQQRIGVVVNDLPGVRADRLALEHIFSILLDNAVKYFVYARPGVVEISGELVNGDAVFHVHDNGRGMSPEDIPRAFGMFQRVGRQDVPGEGMGLAYVKTLVRRCGGRIWCESELGVGSTFSFTVPLGAALREDDRNLHLRNVGGTPDDGERGMKAGKIKNCAP